MADSKRGEGRGPGGAGRPARPPVRRRPAVRKPPLPEERPRIDREAYRDLRASAGADLLDDLVKAYGMAGAALAEGDAVGALPYLEWAKAVAARSSSVREALGIVRYQLGEFSAAAAELATYRRLSGRQDQNHLLADCARATGHPERVSEYIDAMAAVPGMPRARLVEGLLVLAGAAGDRGDWAAAFAALARADLTPARVEPWHPRVWYAAADLAERAGDPERAREYLEAVVSVDPDFLDAATRLESRSP